MPNRAGRLSVAQILLLVTAALAAAIVLPRLIGGDGRGDGAAPHGADATAADAPRPSGTGTKVNPDLYRTQIQALEALVYQGAPSGLSTGDRISQLAAELGNAVLTREPRVRATQAGAALLGYSSRIGSESDVGYATVNLPRARQLWEQVRRDVFLPAPWFQGSSPDLAAAQTARPPVTSPAAVRQLQDVATGLERLITLGRREVSRFPDPHSLDPRSAALRTQREAFQRWAREWTVRINNVLDIMPALGPNAATAVSSAFQELMGAARALNEVGQTRNQYGLPTEGERESNFRVAESGIRSARGYLQRT